MSSGVYQITVGRKTYIGSSVNVQKRCAEHLRHLKTGVHVNRYLQRAFVKHKTAEFKVLLYCAPGMRIEYEQRLLDGLKPEYNASRVAGKVEMTPDVRAKLSHAAKNRKVSSERRARAGELSLERWANPAFQALRSACATTQWTDPESRDKLVAGIRAARANPEFRAGMKEIKREQNRRYEAFGRLWSLKEAAEEYKVSYSALLARLAKEWDLERALTTPVRKKRPNGVRIQTD